MRFHILTLFPSMFRSVFEESIVKSARDNGIVEIDIIDIRDFTSDRHRTADDYPFGGGSGMILKPEPIFLAVESLLREQSASDVPVVLLSPQGRILNQEVAKELSQKQQIILICGHYKGIDERVRLHLANDEISLGDFVISGGELVAMVIVDAVTRLLPGALGDLTSAETDSFYDGLLECGHYTRPRNFRGYQVPEVLLSGNHEAIRQWRRRDSLRKTLLRRPDLLRQANLTEEDRRLLDEIRAELSSN